LCRLPVFTGREPSMPTRDSARADTQPGSISETYATAAVAGQPLLCRGEDFRKTDLELV
jgi:hypothetical protein